MWRFELLGLDGPGEPRTECRRSFVAGLTIATAILAALLLATPAVQAADPAELDARLEQLRAEIAQIQARLDSNLASRDELRLELAQAERAVAELERERRATAQTLTETENRIAELEIRIESIESDAAAVAGQLGAQLRLAYQQGGQSRLKLMLNQDDPRALGRQMAYHGYLSRARLELLSELDRLNQRLRDSRDEVAHEVRQLSALEARQGEQLRELEQARAERDATLVRLEQQIESQAARLAAMQRDAEELEILIEELAEALRDIPMDIDVPSILNLRGQLPLPAPGSLRRRFGDARGGELSWNGWLIDAAAGAAVRAVAHGRIAYADWLRGYGMLLIIDHGDGIMSLYGHNESLLRRVGDWVAAGDEIAIVGESGGNEAGLYFELRQDGQPVNPAGWMVRP